MQLAFANLVTATLTVLGVILAGAVIAWHAIRYRRLSDTVSRLAFTALDGRPEEARVEARNSGRALAPLLDALGGKLTAPRRRPWLQDAVIIFVLHLPLVLLVVYGTSAVRTAELESRLPAAGGLFFGVAIGLPVALIASTLVVAQARRAARSMRATCISLIAKTVKVQVDAELSESLRRGGIRDPRGE